MNFRKQKKYALIALSDIGSILIYVGRSNPLLMWGGVPSIYEFGILDAGDWSREYECQFVPDASYQSLNKGKLSKRQRRSLG